MGETDAPDSYRLRYRKYLEVVTQQLGFLDTANKSDAKRVRELLTLTKGFVHIASHPSIQPHELAEAERMYGLARKAADRISGKQRRRLSELQAESTQNTKIFQRHEPVPVELSYVKQARTVSGGLPSLGGRR